MNQKCYHLFSSGMTTIFGIFTAPEKELGVFFRQVIDDVHVACVWTTTIRARRSL